MTDMIKSPKHYQFYGMESVEIIVPNMTMEQFKGACFFNSMKYRIRAGKKDPEKTVEDIEKSLFFEELYRRYLPLCSDWGNKKDG